MNKAKHINKNDTYIEVPSSLWGLFIKAWMLDKSQPQPMIKGHRMFSDSEHYNVKVSDYPKELAINQAAKILIDNNEIL